MATFNADLETLGKLANTLHDLARQADGVKPVHPAASPNQSLLSPAAADSIEQDLLLGALIPTVKARLEETGDVMANIAKQFAAKDDDNAAQILDLYRQSLGDWTAS
jgi:hypothetical protein